jgi:hypothetical protein
MHAYQSLVRKPEEILNISKRKRAEGVEELNFYSTYRLVNKAMSNQIQ